uniref:ATPbinding Cassette (ABC) Superfamily putative n=1 Tax=Albugo laibachii Nc14 TaxID=890382 RepID=F0W671_9STRA|nr:ATPbinding Cassette (ABC) Superfamily putative [Albugo laibachii Nc14]|eukprot:CCA16613.1 ATPbinding Cassette (ABC) Superfamily putative [Albugo laibachii Nc14]
MMLPVSCVNCLLKYGHTDLVLRFRNRLTRFLYAKYLNQYSFYKVTNLDIRLKNVDQVMTVDVERFASSVVHLYGNICKPILDICIYTIKLSTSIGVQGPSYMLLYLISSGLFLTWTRQPTGTFTIAEQQLEGRYRSIHSRILAYAEEIAFYNGQGREQMILEQAFEKLRGVIQKSQQFRFIVGMLDNIVAKYFATIVGFWVVSKPFLDPSHPQHGKASFAQRMESYFRSGKMLIKLSKSMGCLVLSGREVTRLAAFTSRVSDMIHVLSDLSDSRFQSMIHDSISVPEPKDQSATALGLHPDNGQIEYQDQIIKFEDVPLVTPIGNVLVRSLNLKVESGMNVIVAGPNGCGKSSLFRVLGELWPIFGGKITKPKRSDLFYIPQRPYLSIGTLRDQIIYPHSVNEMRENGRTDEQLLEFLRQVQLEYIAEREAGLDSEQEWTDVLSGGEKQRIAMARLFYHKPQFAILDECTSAVSVDVEGGMYTHCCSQNITLFTVSHRKSLWKYHQYVLQFDGHGDYIFKEISENDQVFGS